MKNVIAGKWYISTTIQGEVLDLPYAYKYGIYLNEVIELSPITIKNYMESLERFWKWTLSEDPNVDEEFSEYLARYKQELKDGLILEDREFRDIKSVKFPVLVLKPKTKVSIDEELSRLRVYFNWQKDKQVNLKLNKETINWDYERRRREVSKHAGYISGKINSFALERISKKDMFSNKSVKRFVATDKAFPFQYFLDLIDSANIREKLLYLLMGGTSARVSQALNLTIYDIDYDNRQVYLSDPVIDDPSQVGFLGETRRRWLKREYSIDAQNQHPHNTIQFKYPIPARPNKPLYWLNESFKEIFFQYIAEYNIYPEHLRRPRHPFFFTKKDGGRLLYRPALNKFKSDCSKLYSVIENRLEREHDTMSADKYNREIKDSKLLINIGPHGLRHMYGNYMAELFYRASLSEIPAVAEKVRLYCQYGMGHSSSKSTDVYMNARMDDVILSGEEYFVHYMRDHKYLPPLLFIKGLVA